MRSNYFTGINLDILTKEWLGVGNDCSTIGSDIIVIYFSLRMDEVMVGSEVEEEGFIKSRDGETKGVVMAEGVGVG